MADSPPQLAVSKALRAMLEEATGKPCGLAEPPRLEPTAPSAQRPLAPPPYTILTPITGTVRAPTMSGRADEAGWTYQVTCVSAKDARQVLWLRDRVRAAMLDRNPDGSYVRPVTVDLWHMTRAHDSDGGIDGDGGIVSGAERYLVTVSPA